MNPMIEAAARAMFVSDNRADPEAWDLIPQTVRKSYMRRTTAALRAMMECEVTDAMAVAYWNVYRRAVRQFARGTSRSQVTWRAMLGAILDAAPSAAGRE